MTQTTDGPTLDSGVGPTGSRDLAGDLANMQGQIVELLARLDRPPTNVSIRAGEVCVDIAWTSPTPVYAPVPAPPPPPVAVAVAATVEAAPVPAAAPTVHLTSPGVGVFYAAKEP